MVQELPTGAASAIPVINWSDKHPVKALKVTVFAALPKWISATTASGQAVAVEKKASGEVVFTLAAVEDADAIILR